MTFALILVAIPAMAALNRVRGGGLLAWKLALPGRLAFYCAPLVAFVAWLALPLLGAAFFAACWLLWSLPGWGQWYGLGRAIQSGEPSWWEAFVDRLCGGNDYVAFTLRNTALVLPLALLSPWLVLLGPLQTAAYEIGWRLRPAGGTGWGELLTGALWGCGLAFLEVLP